MKEHISIISSLCTDILNLRARLVWDIPFHCECNDELADNLFKAYDALYDLYKNLDSALLSMENSNL